jgi:hypothetical protein
MDDTVEIPRVRFFKKWELWFVGIALVFVLTVGVFASVAGIHGIGSGFTSTPGNLPVPVPAKTAKTPERTPWTPKSSAA